MLALFMRGATMVLALLSIALTAPFLGVVALGTYVVLQALLPWAIIVLLGLPEACSGILSKFHRSDRLDKGGSYLGSAFLMVAGFVGVCLVLVLVGTGISILRGPLTQITIATVLALILALLAQPFLLAQAPLNADGEVARNTLWAFLTTASTVLAIWLVTRFDPLPQSRLIAVVAASGGANLLARAVMYLFEFKRFYSSSGINTGITAKRARVLLHSGYPFLIINLAALAAFQIDRFVAYHFLSAPDVASLDATLKILMAGHTLYSVLMAKLWRSIGEPWNKGDAAGARKALVSALINGLAFWSAVGIVVLPILKYLVQRLTNGTVVVSSYGFIFAAFLYVAARGLTDAVSIALYAARLQKNTVRIVIAHGLLNIPFSIIGCLLLGLPGIMVGQLLSLLATSSWTFPRIFWLATSRRR